MTLRNSSNQVRLQSAIDHCGNAFFRIGRESYRYGAPATQLVFQDAQRFVELADDEVDEPGTQSLAKTLGIRIDAQGSRSGDACGHDRGNSVGAPSSAQQQLSAQSVLKVFTRQAGDGEIAIVNAGQLGKGRHLRSYSVTPGRRVT